MKKTLVAMMLVGALVACGGKNKGTNTPANKDKATEMKGGTGGAAYGGQKPAEPAKDAANPCTPPATK